VKTELKDIAPSLIRDFAKQARNTDAGELKDFTPAKRYTLLLCLIQSTKARTRDAVAATVVRRIATIHKRAKNELLERQLEQRERVDRLLGSLGEVIQSWSKNAVMRGLASRFAQR
jgi:Zn-dependent oligopeptidase